MTEYITEKDLEIINVALAKGETVKIRRTANGGAKIIKETEKLIKTTKAEK